VRSVLGPSGERLLLRLDVGRSALHLAVWEVRVGRVPLYLMDTHLEQNSPEDQEISSRLYGGDRTMRLRQEMVLA